MDVLHEADSQILKAGRNTVIKLGDTFVEGFKSAGAVGAGVLRSISSPSSQPSPPDL